MHRTKGAARPAGAPRGCRSRRFALRPTAQKVEAWRSPVASKNASGAGKDSATISRIASVPAPGVAVREQRVGDHTAVFTFSSGVSPPCAKPPRLQRPLVRELHAVEPRVDAPLARRARRASRLDDAPLVEDDDAVRRADGREAVRDDERRAPLHHRLERALQARLGVRVDARGRLVEDEQRRVAVDGPREREELPLAGAEVRPALVDACVEPAPRFVEELERADARERLLGLARGRASGRSWRRSTAPSPRRGTRPAARPRTSRGARGGRSCGRPCRARAPPRPPPRRGAGGGSPPSSCPAPVAPTSATFSPRSAPQRHVAQDRHARACTRSSRARARSPRPRARRGRTSRARAGRDPLRSRRAARRCARRPPSRSGAACSAGRAGSPARRTAGCTA